MSTKDTLRTLARLFGPPTTTTSTGSDNPFPDFVLPEDVNSLIDGHLRSFAASVPPLGAGHSGAGQSESDKERARWREGLLDIWTSVEPLPGTESKLGNLARVSAFLLLLHRLSADAGEDDDAALVSRRDIGSVWWTALLRRTMLGTPKNTDHSSLGPQSPAGGGLQSRTSQTRGRKQDRKGKDPAVPSPAAPASPVQSTASPLYVSRQALTCATGMVVWGMQASREHADKSDDWISPFGIAILHEYEQRALARLQGYEDEGWGVRNLEECLVQWGEKAPKVGAASSHCCASHVLISASCQAFFSRVADSLSADAPALLPFVSLTLSYLARHSTKAYYALSTPLVANLITVALTTPSAAVLTLAMRALAIFVVTLPVVIGEHLFGIMAVYGRAVSWEIVAENAEEGDAVEARADDGESERALAHAPSTC